MKKYIHTLLLAFLITSQVFLPVAIPATLGYQIDLLLSQVRTASGGVLAGGHVHFYAAGSTTPKAVYLDVNKNTQASNPYQLTSNGTALLYGDGLYRIIIHTSTNSPAYDFDNVRYEDLSSVIARIPRAAIDWGPGATQLPRYYSTSAFADNLTLYGNDLIVKGPWVDVRAYMDGVGGRPTLAAWKADMENVDVVLSIQAAVDNAIKGKISNVFMPDGWYKISGPIHLGYGGGTVYTYSGYSTVNLIGTGPQFGASIVVGGWAGVTIDARSFSNAPAIVIQGGRNSGVYNLSIMGAGRGTGAAPTALYETAIHTNTVSYDNISTPANWSFNTSAAGQTRYAPYAGIAIDPYSGTRPGTSYPDVTYPSDTGITTQYGKLASSRTLIKNVSMYGFYVGVAIQPCDYDGNGDYTTVADSQLDGLVYGISIGNTNSRNVSIKDTQFGANGGMHTVLTGDTNGRQTGYFGGPMTNISVRRAFQLFSFNLAQGGPMLFEDLYSEGGIVRLGYLGTAGTLMNTITFRNSRIVTIGYSNAIIAGSDGFNACIYNVPWFEGFGNIVWDSSSAYSNCKFASMTRRLREPVNLVSSNIFSSSYYGALDNNWKLAHNYFLGGVAVVSAQAEFSGVSWVPVYLSGLPASSPALTSNSINDTVSGREPIHRYAKWYKNQYGPTIPIQNINKWRDFTFTGMSPAFDNSTLILTFTYTGSFQANNEYRIEPGTVLWHEGSEALFIVDSVSANGGNWNISATMATNYYYTGANTKAPIATVALTGLLSLYQTFHKGSTFQWRGTTTAASDNVTSMTCNATGDSACGDASASFKVGDLVWNSPYNFDNRLPAATKVIAAGSNWIQLDTVATNNATGVAIELFR
jgi:hypothetical protein